MLRPAVSRDIQSVGNYEEPGPGIKSIQYIRVFISLEKWSVNAGEGRQGSRGAQSLDNIVMSNDCCESMMLQLTSYSCPSFTTNLANILDINNTTTTTQCVAEVRQVWSRIRISKWLEMPFNCKECKLIAAGHCQPKCLRKVSPYI